MKDGDSSSVKKGTSQNFFFQNQYQIGNSNRKYRPINVTSPLNQSSIED